MKPNQIRGFQHLNSFQENESCTSISAKSNETSGFCASLNTSQHSKHGAQGSSFGYGLSKKRAQTSDGDSFFSESDHISKEDQLDDQLILQKKVDKRDIVFRTKHYKESFIRYFSEVICVFLKEPNDLTFSIALDRLKFYNEDSPFVYQSTDEKRDQGRFRLYQTEKNHQKEDSLRYSEKSNCNTAYSSEEFKIQSSDCISVEEMLKGLIYEQKYQHMIYTFDYALCHLTFVTAIIYFWAKVDNPITGQILTFSRLSEGSVKLSQKQSICESVLNDGFDSQEDRFKENIFRTLKIYIEQRSQSLNINQVSILLVYFFLNYLKHSMNSTLSTSRYKEIVEIQQNFINNLKLYRRIKRMEKEFNTTSNKVIFESQIHKYQYENKLISSIDKTHMIFQLINTHNFVSSPLQKYYQLEEYSDSRKYYQLKKDYFCVWVMNIILRLCEKKSAESLSKSSLYIVTFMAILKKFKKEANYQGISVFLPILFNIKEKLPKVWDHALSRRKQLDLRLREYSKLLEEKLYKREDISKECNAISSEQVIYEMCERFASYIKKEQNFADSTVKQSSSKKLYQKKAVLINIEKHKKFYEQFLSHIIYHRKQILEEYSDEIETYKQQKEIGTSFNMYLLDNYVWKTYRGTNSRVLWTKLTERAKAVNETLEYSYYIDIIDYCFVGSTMKSKQLDI